MKRSMRQAHEAGPNPNDAPPSGALRRRLLFTGVAGFAVAGGLLLATRRPSQNFEGSDAVEAFWQLELETPSGGKLVTASLRGAPLLINFWATWCPPCVEELPLLDAFYRARSNQNWRLLGLAVDQRAAVQKFLERIPLAFPTALAGLQGIALTRAFGNESGGLPFSVLIDSRGRVEQRKLGTLTQPDLQRWLDRPG